jgi:hypothetical protein
VKVKTLRELRAPPASVGRVEMIVVRGHARDPARSIESTQALAGIGLADDRFGRQGEADVSTRPVTPIQH